MTSAPPMLQGPWGFPGMLQLICSAAHLLYVEPGLRPASSCCSLATDSTRTGLRLAGAPICALRDCSTDGTTVEKSTHTLAEVLLAGGVEYTWRDPRRRQLTPARRAGGGSARRAVLWSLGLADLAPPRGRQPPNAPRMRQLTPATTVLRGRPRLAANARGRLRAAAANREH